ncbi:tetratricopeptide repeat protein [Sediminibacillus massiliensis]|uniref:tetratricopeptide repeat protein n=1 Tax=Sediminibacillus massiliensis TaxID=1926277 RepID=UPI0009882E68|nr:phosphotransferase [Sediminibacillus massiliensis]
MESDLLQKAKEYQKKKHWKEAANCFSQYMKLNKHQCPETAFVAYARSLRIIGKTDAAEEILQKGLEQHPESQRILVEIHNLDDFTGNWTNAEEIAKLLVRRHPDNDDYYFRLGRTYSFLSEYEKAKKAYRKALELTHGLSFDELTGKIQKGISEEPSGMSSKYIFIDGKNNLGAFIHRYNNKRYFTKISKYHNPKTGAGREETFYKEIVKEFPSLRGTVPEFVDAQIIDKISYLTIEMIETFPMEEDHYRQILLLSQKLTSVRFGDIASKHPKPEYVFQFKKGRAISVVHFFTQIHEKYYNEKVFESLKLIARQHKYPDAVVQIIGRLEKAIMDNRLFKYLNPSEHYSLLHGDFAFQNILIDKKDGQPKVIDWTSYTTGPHFIDIARFLTSLLLPYSTIKTLFLEDDQLGKDLTLIEHIFFLYALVLFYFQKLGRKGIETELSIYLLPAIEDLEKLVLTWTLTEEGNQLQEEYKQYEDEIKQKDLKIEQLQQKNQVLKEERKNLHRRLEDTLNSKSWKLTAPLRIFQERRVNKKHF